MYCFIFGFQRLVWWPKWTPASKSSFIVIDAKKTSVSKFQPYDLRLRSKWKADQKSPTGRRSLLATIKPLPFRELEAFPRSRLSIFFAFLCTRIASQKSSLFESLAQVRAK